MMNVYKKIAVASICFAGGITMQASDAQMQLASALELALLLPKKRTISDEQRAKINKMATDLAEKNAKRQGKDAFDALSKNAKNKKMTREEKEAIHFITLNIKADTNNNIKIEKNASAQDLIKALKKLPESLKLTTMSENGTQQKWTRNELIDGITKALIISLESQISVNENDEAIFSEDLTENEQILDKLNNLNQDLTINLNNNNDTEVPVKVWVLRKVLIEKIEELKREQRQSSAAKKAKDIGLETKKLLIKKHFTYDEETQQLTFDNKDRKSVLKSLSEIDKSTDFKFGKKYTATVQDLINAMTPNA